MADRAGLEKLARMRDAELQGAMLDQFRLVDQYRSCGGAPAPRRARSRRSAPKAPPPLLLAWYFERRLKQAIPDDLAEYAAGIGLRDLRISTG